MEGRAPLILVLAAAMAIAGGALYLVLKSATPVVDKTGAPHPPPPSIATPPNAPVTAPPAAAEPKSGAAIYRCQKGRSITYSDVPCDGGRLVDIQPPRGYEAPATAAPRSNGVTKTELSASTTGAAADESTRPAECKRIDELLAWLDSEARQGGAVARMEELKERRRKASDRRYELRC